ANISTCSLALFCLLSTVFSSFIRLAPRSPLFPYTTLFRSNAALAGGTLGYYCDIEAHHVEAILHGPAAVVPSAIAVGERVGASRSEEHTSELQSLRQLVCRLLLEKKKPPRPRRYNACVLAR